MVGATSMFPVGRSFTIPRRKSGPLATKVLCISNGLSEAWVPLFLVPFSPMIMPGAPQSFRSGIQRIDTITSGAGLVVLIFTWSSGKVPSIGVREKITPAKSVPCKNSTNR